MTGGKRTTGTASRDRVRLVRRFSKWLTKADGLAQDAAKLKRDGVAIPDAWGFTYRDFFTITGLLRKYLTDTLQAATEPSAAAAQEAKA